jgi:hypothetical protein
VAGVSLFSAPEPTNFLVSDLVIRRAVLVTLAAPGPAGGRGS